jgi:hypothetical protein
LQKEQRKQRKLDEKRKKEERKRQKKDKKKKRKTMEESDSEVSGGSDDDDDSSDEWQPPSDLEGQITPYKDEYGSSGNEGRLRKRGRSGDEGGMAVRLLCFCPCVCGSMFPQRSLSWWFVDCSLFRSPTHTLQEDPRAVRFGQVIQLKEGCGPKYAQLCREMVRWRPCPWCSANPNAPRPAHAIPSFPIFASRLV